ncbi:CHASE3 domain-containing protein [Povalibacter sp.]|uniref:CHASE3 domain-containing protein n=1 Tax=Povalibacter sp. TaxID=1962978 RepID=UPI002F42DA93
MATGQVPLAVVVITFVSIALLLLNATLLVINTAGTMDSNEQYARSYEIKRSLTEFQSTIATAESGQRGYLLTGQTAYLEPFQRAVARWRAEIERLRTLVADNGGTGQSQRATDLNELEALTANAVARLEDTIRQTGQAGNADVAGTGWATADMDLVRERVTRMVEEEDMRIEALRGEVLHDMWLTVGVAVFTTVLTVGVLIGLQALLRRYVAARARAEGALLEANQQLNRQVEERTAELSELSQHLISVSEEEKARIARELHDTLGSNLTAINMDLNWINKRLPPEHHELRDRLQRSLQMLADTVELKHEVIEGLRPSHLDNLGLSYAIRTHCREFTRRTGIPCEVQVAEDFDDLDPAWSIALYRIAQEALTNITRHAHAKSVHVELSREEAGIRLRIIDDGAGIPDGAISRAKSHGLIGMRERMRQIGGVIHFGKDEVKGGTIVDAFIPRAAV